MSARGIVVEIVGHPTAYATHSGAPTTWATTVLPALISVPQGSALSIDYDTLRADSGGTELEITDASAQLQHEYPGATALLDGAHTAAATTITVNSTAGFDSSGTIWIGQEAISYAGTTATTFTGCTRASLGTTARKHATTTVVYSYPNTLFGRKVVLKWYDYANTASTTTRYTGIIDAVDFGDGQYRLTILSSKEAFDGAKGLHLTQGKGRLEFEIEPINRLEISTEGEQSAFLSLPATSTNWPNWYIRIDDELIGYKANNITYPAYSTTVATVTSGYEITITPSNGFDTGRTIEFLSGGDVVATGIITDRIGATVIHNAGYTPTVTDVVQVAGIGVIEGAERGAYQTRAVTHEIGAEVTEYRVLDGNQVDILLWLMLSDQGDKTNSEYDILPVGWGCAIDEALVDIAAFETILKPRASHRRYIIQEELDLLDLLGTVATATNCRIYWGTDGILTANAIHDIFPLDAAAQTVTISNVVRGTHPTIRIDRSQIRNIWEWRSDYDLDGDHRALMRVEDVASRDSYRDRPMPVVEDKGVRASEHNGITYTIAKALLSQRSQPVVILTAEILFDESISYYPGMLMGVTFSGLPNMQGGKGLTGELFELLAYQPNEGQATASITLARRKTIDDLGHVAPVCIVESIDGSEITVRPRAYSRYAPAIANFTPPGGSARTGLEDVDWFLDNDSIRYVDVSTLGSGTPTSATDTVNSVDFDNRLIIGTSLPGWLAAGDLIQLDDWATVYAGGNVLYRAEVFLALADDTTGLIDTQDPKRWGL